jgi:hypothetical protein
MNPSKKLFVVHLKKAKKIFASVIQTNTNQSIEPQSPTPTTRRTVERHHRTPFT